MAFAVALLTWPSMSGAQERAESEFLSSLPEWAQVRRPPVRRAVVLNIADYPPPLTLTAPPHDARHVRDALAGLGFEFARPPNRLDRDGILNAVEALAAATEPGDVTLVYFSGHGVSRHGVENYLVPVDAGSPPAGDEEYVWVNLSAIIDILSERSPGVTCL